MHDTDRSACLSLLVYERRPECMYSADSEAGVPGFWNVNREYEPDVRDCREGAHETRLRDIIAYSRLGISWFRLDFVPRTQIL